MARGGDASPEAGIGRAPVGAESFGAPAAVDALTGGPATEERFAAAAAAAAEACDPVTDQRGPADYKRHLAGELTLRALRRATARARGEGA